MSMDAFMKRSLELQERHAKAMEAIASSLAILVKDATTGVSIAQVSTALKDVITPDKPAKPERVHLAKGTNGTAEADFAGKPVDAAASDTSSAAATAQTGTASLRDTSAASPASTAAEKPKKVTVDDARGALKKYAAREGNDAAMELLKSLGATSISSLAEQGEDKLRELVKACEEALK